jgi:hypothetical protein
MNSALWYRPYYETKGTINVPRCFTLASMCFCLFAGCYLIAKFNVANNPIITREKTWIHDLNNIHTVLS